MSKERLAKQRNQLEYEQPSEASSRHSFHYCMEAMPMKWVVDKFKAKIFDNLASKLATEVPAASDGHEATANGEHEANKAYRPNEDLQ